MTEEIGTTSAATSTSGTGAAERGIAPAGTQKTVPAADVPPGQRDIKEIADDILSRKGRIVHSFIEIGKLLIEAKEQLTKHGEWLNWLSTSVDISERMAERYMQLARAYPNSTSVSDLGMTKALALLALPEAQREDFINTPHEVGGKQKNVREMSTREVRRIVRAVINSSKSGRVSHGIPPVRRRRERDIFMSDLQSAQEYLNSVVKFLEKNTEDPTAVKEFHDGVCSLSEIAQKFIALISSEASTEIE